MVIGTNDDDSLELYAIFGVTAGIPAFYLILEKKKAIREAAIGLLFHNSSGKREHWLLYPFSSKKSAKSSQLCPKIIYLDKISRRSCHPCAEDK